MNGEKTGKKEMGLLDINNVFEVLKVNIGTQV